MNLLATKTFTAQLVSESSFGSQNLGKHKSTMELFSFPEDPNYYFIEWDIPTLEEVENIGIWCEENTKKIYDYDGVMCLSAEAIELLKENGFDTSEVE
jgi:hypothetical protein